MKTFKQFLEAGGEVQDLEDFIIKNCHYMMTAGDFDMDELLHNPLWRGIQPGDSEKVMLKVNGVTTKCMIKKVRKDRKPLDANPQFHKAVDDIFEKKFKWRPRSEAMFCSSDLEETSGYGTPHKVFPIGRFKFLWTPDTKDLIIPMNKAARHAGVFNGKGNEFDEGVVEKFSEVMEQYIEANYTDTNFYHAIESGNEIMIGCDTYLAVPYVEPDYDLGEP